MGWRCLSLAVLLIFASVGYATVSSREDDGWGRCSGEECLEFLKQVPLTDGWFERALFRLSPRVIFSIAYGER
jgi:hypothetical protein